MLYSSKLQQHAFTCCISIRFISLATLLQLFAFAVIAIAIISMLSFVTVTPYTKCRLKQLKLERIKDFLLMEEEFIKNQERLKPQEEKEEVKL